MGKMWDRIKSYFRANFKKNYKTILIDAGSLIKVWVGALIGIAIGAVTGQPIIWGTAFGIGLGATCQYIYTLVNCTFGEKAEEK